MRRQVFLYVFIAAVSVAGVSVQATADVPPEQVAEVEHLLDFVKNSGCIINRNGVEHPAENGVSHIMKKYDYYRDDTSSTEDFIRYSATKSILSGSYYSVTCPGKKAINTQDWLLEELQRYRAEAR